MIALKLCVGHSPQLVMIRKHCSFPKFHQYDFVIATVNMERFEIAESNSKDLDSRIFKDYITVKYSDEKWKNFKPFVLSPRFKAVANAKKDLKVFDDDVFVISFPRSGTTLMQELVWLIVNDCDFEAARKKVLFERFPELE